MLKTYVSIREQRYSTSVHVSSPCIQDGFFSSPWIQDDVFLKEEEEEEDSYIGFTPKEEIWRYEA